MKYLKLFESDDWSYDNMVSDLRDICLDLEDEGFKSQVWKDYSEKIVTITTSNGYDAPNLETPKMKHIKVIIDRLHECCKAYGFVNMVINYPQSKNGTTTSKVLPGGLQITLRKL